MALRDKITIGADPELVLTDAKGVVVPAWRLTKGTKLAHEMLDSKAGISIHADGTALEYNFKPSSLKNFSATAANALAKISDYAGRRGYLVKAVSQVDTGYSAEDLQHPLALESGCDPDFYAYSDNPEIPRTSPAYSPTAPRFFGGHIHIGYDTSIIPPWAMARLLDVFWYCRILNYDKQALRRKHHGQPGVFRPKPYGVEYRTPSNFWVGDTAVTNDLVIRIGYIFDQLDTNKERLNTWFHSSKKLWPSVAAAISSAKPDAALALYSQATFDLNGDHDLGV